MPKRKAKPPRRFLIEELPREGYWRHWTGLFADREAAADFAKAHVSSASFAITDITDLPQAVWSRGEWTEVST